MAKKASGQELIEHKSFIVDNLGEHFNNPDISDVTLTVGDQVFAAHRLILATQSKVFMAMLMGESWKESDEKKITLQESPDGTAAFSDFLKFFYTGTLTLTIDNVCGIHTLADKYDVSVLKDDCVNFMKEVLTGVHGDALKAGLEWLQYMETFLPDMASLCYSAIRTNFVGVIVAGNYKDAFWKLTFTQIKSILANTEVQEQLVMFDEKHLVNILDKGQWPKKLLPYVRLYNIDFDQLQSIKPDNNVTKYVNEAYKIHAERSNIASKACKRRRLSQGFVEVTCSCDSSRTHSQVCPHINPRLYMAPPFGMCMPASSKTKKVEPIDLSDLAGFSQTLIYPEDRNDNKEWHLEVDREYPESEDPIYERYTITPARCHLGRDFTLAVICVMLAETKIGKYEYGIKFTGTVTETDGRINAVVLDSPHRFQESWELTDKHGIGITILLHKR